METNVKEIDVKTNAYNAGRLYAIYEAIFKESGARMNQFYQVQRNPAAVISDMAGLAVGESAYNKYEKSLCEVYDDISELPNSLDVENRATFVMGYYHQRNKLHKKEH